MADGELFNVGVPVPKLSTRDVGEGMGSGKKRVQSTYTYQYGPSTHLPNGRGSMTNRQHRMQYTRMTAMRRKANFWLYSVLKKPLTLQSGSNSQSDTHRETSCLLREPGGDAWISEVAWCQIKRPPILSQNCTPPSNKQNI